MANNVPKMANNFPENGKSSTDFQARVSANDIDSKT